MSTVRIYRWDDAGAPSLSGQVGALNNVLRKCLVGISGVAYGATPSAGWSEAFAGTATNIAAFRNNPGDGASGCYVHVNDNAPGSAGAREAQLTVYGAMTDIATGTAGTSTAWARKSSTADSTARKWLVVADGLTAWVLLYDFGSPGGAGNGFDTTLFGVGDYACVAPSNAYRYFCMGRASENSNFGGDILAFNAGSFVSKSAAFTVRALDGVAGIVQPSISLPLYSTGGAGGEGYPTPPHAITGDVYFRSNPEIRDGSILLGRLRGLRIPFHNIMAVADGADYPGFAGQVVAKTRIGTSSNSDWHVGLVLDSLGPWL